MKNIPLFLLIFFIGFSGGVLWVLVDERWMDLAAFLGWNQIWKIEQMEVDKRALFFLICGKRLRAFFILWIFSLTRFRKRIAIVFFLFWGFSTGIAAQLLAICYGEWSLLLYPGVLLPQLFFYIPAFLGMGGLCMKEKESEKKELMESLLYFLLILGGAGVEAWVGSELLKLIVERI